MKIAHVVDSMEVGGAETLVSQMCQLQREQGHDPSVYAVAALGPLGERLRAQGFSVQAHIGKHLLDASTAFIRAFRSARPDVVHLHNPTPTIYAAPAARLAGVPTVISTRHSLVAPPRNLTMERKYAVSARFCDWIVGICEATRYNIEEAGSAPPAKLVRVYNGTTPFAPGQPELCPRKLGFTLLYVGRLEPVKNLAWLLQAFAAASAEGAPLHLWIVGDGSERQRLEALSSTLGLVGNVTFWGQQLEVAPFYAVADAFVMSSISEGLPMSLLQAFSAGLPALVTEVGGMAEVVQLAKAGITVPLTDLRAMAEAMRGLERGVTARKEFAANGRVAFGRYFTLEAMMASYVELYRNTPRWRKKQGA